MYAQQPRSLAAADTESVPRAGLYFYRISAPQHRRITFGAFHPEFQRAVEHMDDFHIRVAMRRHFIAGLAGLHPRAHRRRARIVADDEPVIAAAAYGHGHGFGYSD